MSDTNTPSFARYLAAVERLVAQGGPQPDEDEALTELIAQVSADLEAGLLSDDDRARLRTALRFTPETMQGFAYLKPNGHAGCYEIIDRIYRRYHAADPALFNWDRYWQRHSAAEAVRNRKDYFQKLVLDIVGRRGCVSILNVASGSCRDVQELFDACPDLPVQVVCVEQDPRAIEYAAVLCREHLTKVSFREGNAFKYSVDERYDLVWSAGLFDYLSDRLFVRLAARLAGMVKPGGELVIGNFNESNPSRPYMELFDWVLNHRSPETLGDLAVKCGFVAEQIEVRAEPAGVTLFLHPRRSAI